MVSFSFFFLALVINQSTVVGQTTAESVIEFPKNDIRDVRDGDSESVNTTSVEHHAKTDITSHLDTPEKFGGKLFVYHCGDEPRILIHYNNGVTEYNENWSYL